MSDLMPNEKKRSNDEIVLNEFDSGMDYSKEHWQDSSQMRILRRVLDLMATFLLEVMGGAGAVWGSSECAGVRVGIDNDEWRCVCWGAFILCIWRWGSREFYGKTHVEMEVMAVFLLDVLGGAGAMWGCLEIAGYRTNYPDDCGLPDRLSPQGTFSGLGGAWGPPGRYKNCAKTMPESRIICAPIFVLCWLAWVDVYGWQKLIVGDVTFYTRTYLLQVMGGAGALWGFSEICGKGGASLRYGWGDIYFGQKSFDFWRICCGIVFILCNIRWVFTCLIPGPPTDWNRNDKQIISATCYDPEAAALGLGPQGHNKPTAGVELQTVGANGNANVIDI